MRLGLFGLVALAAVGWAFGGFAADLSENPVPALGQNARSSVSFDPAKRGARVLFVGNSITLHGPRPQIGWTNNWGMAASARERDYVHLLQARIAAVSKDSQCGLLQVADSFERGFWKAEWSCGAKYAGLDGLGLDVVVFFFGANVPIEYDRGALKGVRSFGRALEELADWLDPKGRALKVVVQGFYGRPLLEREKVELATRRGFVYVPIEAFRDKPEVKGMFSHPNDRGMALIADAIWGAIAERVGAAKGRQ